MSLQDRLGSANGLSLLTLGASLALLTTNGAHRYNFSLFLFGIVGHELTSSSNPLRIFISFVFFTAIYDLFLFLTMTWAGGLSAFFSFLVMLLKVPVFLTCLNTLRERGGDIQWSVPNLQSFQGLGGSHGNQGGGGIPQGSTVWSMPGGFGGGSPAQPSQSQNTQPAASTFPSGGGFRLGGDDDDQPSPNAGNAPSGPPPGKNGYSSIA